MRGLIDSGILRRGLAIALGPAVVAATVSLLAGTTASAEAPAPSLSVDAHHPDVKPPDGKPPSPIDAPKPDVAPKPLDVKPDISPVPDTKPIPPDPVPLEADAIWVVTFRFAKSNVTISKVREEKLAKKTVLPRHFGRFAAELYVGPTLVERLRFDFPLIHDDLVGDAYEKGLDVSIDVKLPESERPTRLEVWDRATDRRWTFPYPPK